MNSARKVKREDGHSRKEWNYNENSQSPDNGTNKTKQDDDEICELEHLRKLFVGGLASHTTEESLKTFYEQWGKIVDVVVMRDTTTRRSRGFGFVTFSKASMVDRAQDNRPHVIDGKTVEAKRSLPRPQRETRETNISVKKLFVGGLKDNHDEPCLNEYFSQFGQVISVKILMDKTTGKRRGFAFVEFDDYDAVDKAVLKKQHSIKYVVVDVKKSVYKQEQEKRQIANNNQTNQYQPNNTTNSAPIAGSSYPPIPQNMPGYQQPAPMNAGPPPANYNYWGPPPPAMPQQYGGYQQPPPQQMNNWNYAQPAAAGPPPAQSWQPNQWGPPPPAAAPVQPQFAPNAGPPPANMWNAPVPPPVAPNTAPPPHQQQMQPNFGTGYQQNYGGGPTKPNMSANRMNPYNVTPTNNYANNGPPAAPYGAYNAGPPNTGNVPPGPVPQPMVNGAAAVPPVNNFRR